MQEALRGARSQDSGIMTWAEGRRLTTEPSWCPFPHAFEREKSVKSAREKDTFPVGQEQLE